MRALPEMEILRRDLEREYVGKKVKGVESSSMKSLPRYRNRKQFASLLEGHKVKSVGRRGTALVFNLDGTDALVVEPGEHTSVLKAKSSRAAVPKDTTVIVSFSANGQIRFVDPEGEGDLFVVPLEELEDEAPELGRRGLDPLDNAVSWQHFGQLLQGQDTKLKALLLDTAFVAGLGPVYADEILFGAGLRPDRPASSLTAQEVRRLYRALVEVLQDAVKHGGTSLEDDGFTNLYGEPGRYQEHLQIWGREGAPCPRCRKPIRKTRIGKVTTYYSESQV